MRLFYVMLGFLLVGPVTAQDHSTAGDVVVASIPVFDESGNGWAAFEPEIQTIVDGKLVLTSPSFAMTQFDKRLASSGLQVTAEIGTATSVVVALRSQVDARPNGYFLQVSGTGAVLLYVVVDGKERILAEAALEPMAGATAICLRSDGQWLRGWVWPASELIPDTPTIDAFDAEATYHQGMPRLGVREGEVAFSNVVVSGLVFRPKILRLDLWKAEPRIVFVIETTPGSVHRLEETVDRKEWRTRYLIEADPDGDTTTVVVPGSFQEAKTPLALTRVINAETNEGTPARSADFLFPTTKRIAVTWESLETVTYQFEYSIDLQQWKPFEHLQVPGAAGERSTKTVLALPRELNTRALFFIRVVER